MKEKRFTSVEKSLDILSCFKANRLSMSAKEISKEIGLPLSSTYRYLEILVKRNFLTKNGRQRYTLGVMLFRLGNLASSMIQLNEVALPFMEKLCKETGETVLLTVVSGFEAVCIERIEVRRLIKLSMERGVGLPLHIGASSKALLAYSDETFIDDYLAQVKLIRLTEKTLTDKDLIRLEMETIRRQGYAFSDGEADLDARGVGVPIFNHVKRLVGGLSFAGPADRIPMQKIPALAEITKKVAMEISKELGFTGRIEKMPGST
jgi:DNA-binding IclR family transcriptional regulator